VGTAIGHYLAPVGVSFLFGIGGAVVGVFAAAFIYLYFRPRGS
jgi:hypothetical protein